MRPMLTMSNTKISSYLICFIISLLAGVKILRSLRNIVIIDLYISYEVTKIQWFVYSW